MTEEHEHKDKTVLYYALGKALFDEKFRARIFEDPKRAANSSGLDICVIDSLASLGREGLEGFVKNYQKALKTAAANAHFC